MSTEELKLIIDAIRQLGAEGKSAFVWWLVVDKVVPTLGWLLTWGSLLLVVMRIVKTVWGTHDYARSDLEMARDLVRRVWLYGTPVGESAQVRAVYAALKNLVPEKE